MALPVDDRHSHRLHMVAWGSAEHDTADTLADPLAIATSSPDTNNAAMPQTLWVLLVSTKVRHPPALANAVQRHLTNDQIRTLTERTEGWIAGLQLSAVSLQKSRLPVHRMVDDPSPSVPII